LYFEPVESSGGQSRNHFVAPGSYHVIVSTHVRISRHLSHSKHVGLSKSLVMANLIIPISSSLLK
jgi:hypothetical protein